MMLNYRDIRSSIKDGDLLAWSHYDWGSWYDLQVQAVRFGTRSEFCHVGIAHLHGGRVWVIESVQPVVRMVPLSNLLKDGAFWVPLNQPICTDELEFLLSRVGLGQYSKAQAVKAQLNALEIGVDDEWQCAELTIASRRLSGVDLGHKATPSEVVRAAMRVGPLYAIEKNSGRNNAEEGSTDADA